MNEGWLKLYYKLAEWEWYGDPNMVATWIHLLISANWKDKKWRGVTIKRGQLITSRAHIAEEIGISEQQTRTCLERLQSTGAITSHATNRYTIITICKYDSYQDKTEHEQPATQPTEQPTNNQQITSQTPTNNQQITTTKDYKEVEEREEGKKEKNISTPLPPSGETAKKKEKKPKEPPHAVTKYDKAFEEAYKKHTGTPFAWSKRENIACNAIVGKIAAIMVAQGQVPTDDSKLDAFKWFIGKIVSHGDEWMKSNFSPHVIDSKFNEYYQRLKSQENGTARNNNQNPYGVSEEYLARIARELGGALPPK